MSDGERGRRVLFLESLANSASGDTTGQTRPADLRPEPPDAVQRRNARRAVVAQGEERLGVASQRNPTPASRQSHSLGDPKRERPAVVPIRQLAQAGKIGEFPSHGLERRRSYAGIISFAICVVLPVILASIYYAFFASNQYVSEFRFSVIDSSSSSTSSLMTAASGLASIMSGSAVPSASQNFLVTDYLGSREVVDELQSKINVIGLYSRPNVDWWARFNSSQPIEKFVPYWQQMVTATYDPITGLAVAQVRAFSAQDAHLIAIELVKLAEHLVNEIATRPQKDAVHYAEREVRRAEDKLKAIRVEMAKYRTSERVIDPNTSVVTTNTTLAQSLRSTLTQLQTELGSLMQQKINPNAPTIQVLQSRIMATKAQLASIESQISKTNEGGRPLSKVVGEYEQLQLEQQFAQNMVTSTMQTLEQARATAAAQHLYITPYVRPSVPDSATYPQRLWSISLLAFYCILAWALGVLLFRSIREHI